jgi:hypothetical protein
MLQFQVALPLVIDAGLLNPNKVNKLTCQI